MPPFAPGTPAYNSAGALIQGITAEGLNQKFAGQTTVFEYGAVGDGVTDDTVALQNALNDAAGKYWLIFPQGYTFLVSAPITVPGDSYIILNGTIKKASQSVGGTAGYFSILNIAGSNGVLSGIGVIDGNKAGQSGTQPGGQVACGLATTYGTNPPAQGSLYQNWVVSGITIQDCVNQPINVAWAYSTARDCLFQNSGNSAEFVYSFRADFVNCRALNISDDGMGFYLGNVECSMIGCVVSGCATGMFILTDTVASSAANLRCRIIGCTASGNTTAGIFIAGQAAGYSEGHTISNNTLTNNGEAGNFDLSYLSDCVFSGNVSLNSVGSVVNIGIGGGANRLTFVGNILQGNGSNIVKIAGDLATGNTAVVFVGNTLFDLTGGGSVGFALFCTGSSGYVSMISNTFSATITIPFADESATKAALFDGTISSDNGSNLKQMTQSLNFVNNSGTTTIGINEPLGEAQFVGLVNVGALDSTGNITGGGLITAGTTSTEDLSASGTIAFGSGSSIGFYGHGPTGKATVTGSKGGNAALASLMSALSALGLVTDSTT